MTRNKFKEKFIFYRRRQGITQFALAAKLYIDASTLSKWVNGHKPWPEDDFIRICEYLELSENEKQELWALAVEISPDESKEDHIDIAKEEIFSEGGKLDSGSQVEQRVANQQQEETAKPSRFACSVYASITFLVAVVVCVVGLISFRAGTRVENLIAGGTATSSPTLPSTFSTTQEVAVANTATFTPIPIKTSTPTFTPTATDTLTPTPKPTNTPSTTSTTPTKLQTSKYTPTPTPIFTPIKPTSSPTRFFVGVVTIENLNVRQGPGIVYGFEGAVYENDEVIILGRSSNGDWLKVDTLDGRTGWVASRYIDTLVNIESLKEFPEPPALSAPILRSLDFRQVFVDDQSVSGTIGPFQEHWYTFIAETPNVVAILVMFKENVNYLDKRFIGHNAEFLIYDNNLINWPPGEVNTQVNVGAGKYPGSDRDGDLESGELIWVGASLLPDTQYYLHFVNRSSKRVKYCISSGVFLQWSCPE